MHGLAWRRETPPSGGRQIEPLPEARTQEKKGKKTRETRKKRDQLALLVSGSRGGALLMKQEKMWMVPSPSPADETKITRFSLQCYYGGPYSSQGQQYFNMESVKDIELTRPVEFLTTLHYKTCRLRIAL